jgi:hypothetical protein
MTAEPLTTAGRLQRRPARAILRWRANKLKTPHCQRRDVRPGRSYVGEGAYRPIGGDPLELEQSRVDPDPLLHGAGRPILQPFVSPGREVVHSITGFIDKTGNFFVTRHSTKILQRSPPLGIGICFESLPAAPSLSKAMHRPCRDIGYFGIFEVEFVCSGGEHAFDRV